jgi:hypothetical protein
MRKYRVMGSRAIYLAMTILTISCSAANDCVPEWVGSAVGLHDILLVYH